MPQSINLLAAKQPNIDKLVHARRQELNLSKESFATEFGITSQQLINWWKNGYVTPSLLAILRIMSLLNESGEHSQIIQPTYL
ncbi:helix-turn-helix domain-containing protein [Nostoc sp.]|uniref:helix-turn-helix domain-containing protein n=1 Tax=Nostoc sp. TaxID=1180 RepID=UPI002FF6EC8D